jgi:group II intron reverse transcriptase/maturase
MSVTRQERRKAQGVDRSAEIPFSLRGEPWEATYTGLIASRAKAHPGMVFKTLMHYFSVEHLRQAYREIEGSKAVGSDGITKEKYGDNLEENLQNLHKRMLRMAYRPAAAKLVLIPKPDGKMRPIAISNFEDKLVQKIAADILTAIYDRTFHRFSFGFRPKRGCHGAIGYLYNKFRRHHLPWVVDVDLKSFFNTIDHKKLLEILSLRISDKTFLRYMGRMLKAGILVEGNCQESEQGTPQGSIVSPILANIFLHHVLDEWFVKTIRPELGGEMVRYADDVVVAVTSEEKAGEFVRRLEERLTVFGLSLNRDKTKTVNFDRENDQRGTFDFLGFTFYWGRWMAETTLKVRTSMRTLQKKIQDFIHWIKGNRSRLKLETLWEKAAQKLQGHYLYYGVLWNRDKLLHFYYEVIGNLFQWLNRRSQKKSYTWEGFKMRLSAKPLPLPAVSRRLIQLTDPRLYCA